MSKGLLMKTSTQWQLARESAERYQEILVPFILGPAALSLVNWACPNAGEVVLDVGCGTGAAARFAAEKVGASGRVIGVDMNAGMISVAKSLPSVNGTVIEWHEYNANQLQINDQKIDLVLCAQSLQFMTDRRSVLAEMYRVLKPCGRAALSLWCDMKDNPYFQVLTETIAEHIGQDTAAGLMAIFNLSRIDEIHSILSEPGFKRITTKIEQLNLALPNLEEFLPRHISATPMATGFMTSPLIKQRKVIQEVTERLAAYKTETGSCIPFSTHLIIAEK